LLKKDIDIVGLCLKLQIVFCSIIFLGCFNVKSIRVLRVNIFLVFSPKNPLKKIKNVEFIEN